ncbi:MAG: 16S rRNA (guanine(527)-N(7))-methyltransferase RsmG [Bacteroidota bacterium]
MSDISMLETYFPHLTPLQKEQFGKISSLYTYWNERINVVSRKDIDNLMVKHVLHSLSIAKVISFAPGTRVLDVGTGGGFPGIPLAILFPDCTFHLVDSIAKKIHVVEEVATALELKNVTAEQKRAEKLKGSYHFVVSRAVTEFNRFYAWTQQRINRKDHFNPLPNGILYLKGGDLTEEMQRFTNRVSYYPISDFFEAPFFETKKVVYVPI